MKDLGRILIVEDKPKHIISIMEQLSEFERQLTIESTFADAAGELRKRSYDVVISDLYIPYSHSPQYPISEVFTGDPQPLGSFLVIDALMRGVPYVSLITDTNHHSGEVPAAVDAINRSQMIGNSVYLKSKCVQGEKNYRGIMNQIKKYRETGDINTFDRCDWL